LEHKAVGIVGAPFGVEEGSRMKIESLPVLRSPCAKRAARTGGRRAMFVVCF
jgi:hypothetical protein